ncbi:MAG: RNA pseudouridine synthase [Pseudomonadota bacterium]
MSADPDFLAQRVLYRDGLMLIVDKPAGYAVHARPGQSADRTVLEYYFDGLRFGFPQAPALAHRLDRDTTGCLILGRHPKALRRLGKLFQEGRVEKTYWAICRGKPEKPAGTIDRPLVKRTNKAGWSIIALTAEEAPAYPTAKSAVTTYRTLGTANGLSLIECKPKTGRTHQLRVHLASIGAPILGDPKYGDLIETDRAMPLMLHARQLIVPLYPKKLPIVTQAEPPAAMAMLLKAINREVDATNQESTP